MPLAADRLWLRVELEGLCGLCVRLVPSAVARSLCCYGVPWLLSMPWLRVAPPNGEGQNVAR